MQMAMWALVVVVTLLILAVYWAVVRGPRVPLAVPRVAQDPPQTCAGCSEVATAVADLAGQMDILRLAVGQGIEHVDRVESRIQGVVKRARKELRDAGVETPGLDAEAAQLSLVHGEGGEAEAMPIVPPGVGGDVSSVPGVTPEQLRRVRGI